MSVHARALLAALLAALVFGAAVGASSANKLSVNETRWTHRWSALSFIAAGRTVRCQLTIEGSFHSAVSQKVVGKLSGLVSRASVAACTGGGSTVLRETLPWHNTYTGFTGILPNIAAISNDLIGASFKVQPTASVACLARTTTTEPARGIISLEEGLATEVTVEIGAEIRLTGEGGLCSFAGRGHFEGTGAITKLGSTALIEVRLI